MGSAGRIGRAGDEERTTGKRKPDRRGSTRWTSGRAPGRANPASRARCRICAGGSAACPLADLADPFPHEGRSCRPAVASREKISRSVPPARAAVSERPDVPGGSAGASFGLWRSAARQDAPLGGSQPSPASGPARGAKSRPDSGPLGRRSGHPHSPVRGCRRGAPGRPRRGRPMPVSSSAAAVGIDSHAVAGSQSRINVHRGPFLSAGGSFGSGRDILGPPRRRRRRSRPRPGSPRRPPRRGPRVRAARRARRDEIPRRPGARRPRIDSGARRAVRIEAVAVARAHRRHALPRPSPSWDQGGGAPWGSMPFPSPARMDVVVRTFASGSGARAAVGIDAVAEPRADRRRDVHGPVPGWGSGVPWGSIPVPSPAWTWVLLFIARSSRWWMLRTQSAVWVDGGADARAKCGGGVHLGAPRKLCRRFSPKS